MTTTLLLFFSIVVFTYLVYTVSMKAIHMLDGHLERLERKADTIGLQLQLLIDMAQYDK